MVAERALEFLKGHVCMSLATTGPHGPWVATVFYVNDGFTLHFLSRGGTRHVRDVESNAHGAAAISEEPASWKGVRGIQLEGRVFRIDNDLERRDVLMTFGNRFAFADSLWWTDAAPSRDGERHVYGLEPERVFFLDRAVGQARIEIPSQFLAMSSARGR